MLSESGVKYAQIMYRLQLKTVLNNGVGGFLCEGTTKGMNFFTGGSIIIVILPKSNGLMLKRPND